MKEIEFNSATKTETVERLACIGDFLMMFKEALDKAGGGHYVLMNTDKVSVRDAAELLAQNGIRFVHMPDRDITHILQPTVTPPQ